MAFPEQKESKEVRRYALPDWGSLDNIWKRSQPFALWKIGEQSLLYHWLDDAVNAEVKKVILEVADRPAEVRRAMEEATLWPIEWEIKAVAKINPEEVHAVLDHLPGQAPLVSSPSNGWELILHRHKLESEWLDAFSRDVKDYPIDLAIGKGCAIDPSTVLQAPYWIGDHVSIGPGCKVGPYAVIGDGAIVDRGARIERSHVGDGTYLGPETDLTDCLLEGATLLNLKHRARVDRLDQFIAADTRKAKPARPSGRERLLAFRLWLLCRPFAPELGVRELTGLDGKIWRLGTGTLADERKHLLKEVWKGRLSLFGPVPRSESEVAGMEEEWREILSASPPGAFSYADVMGAAPGSFEEQLHSVFMATDKTGQTRSLCLHWARDQLPFRLRERAHTLS